jgi:hypothetical protein
MASDGAIGWLNGVDAHGKAENERDIVGKLI